MCGAPLKLHKPSVQPHRRLVSCDGSRARYLNKVSGIFRRFAKFVFNGLLYERFFEMNYVSVGWNGDA